MGGGNKLLAGGISLGLLAGALGTGALVWWGDRGLTRFSLNDTGYFGDSTYAGGADKTGHFFANFVGIKAATAIYESIGLEHGSALAFATALSLTLGTSVELIDGFTSYGFEYNDVVANVLGLALGLATELVPALDETVGIREAYLPSPGFIRGPKSYIKLINDYTGQIIYADLKLKGVAHLFGLSPGPARYFLLGVNWSTKNYEPGGPDPEWHDRERHLGMHLGVNLSEVFTELDLGGTSRFGRAFFKYYALPFLNVSLVRDLNGDRWFWNFGIANRLTTYASPPPMSRP